jgi:hypothetical protein
VEGIISKTREGKIKWEGSPSTLIAIVPGLQLTFVRSSNALAGILGTLQGINWDRFSVRLTTGEELVLVDKPKDITTLPPGERKIIEAVQRLYSAAQTTGSSSLDKAIDVIDKL